MTGQMADVIVINDEEFAIVEPEPGVLFEPRDHGISPVMSHTANTRGVLARYRLDDGKLLLSDLQVGHLEEPPSLAGIEATTDEHKQVWTYLDVDIEVPWSGDLLVGAEPIADLYVHTGFAPIWHYERVLALDIEAGIVEATEDRSGKVAEFRDEQSVAAGDEDDDDNAFERMLNAIRLRIPGWSDDGNSSSSL